MQLKVSESEVREAIVEYIAKHHNLIVHVDDLVVIISKHGQFDDAECVMQGYECKFKQINL
jgi:hypothetical protein